MATSTVPAAIDALVAILDAATELATVDVHDGPAVTSDYPDQLAIAYAGRENPEVVSFEQNAADIRPRHSRDEVFFISCLINAASGDEVMATRRSRAFEILAVVEDVLRENISLGGAVTTAWIADGALLQDLDESGMFAGLVFRVRCKSRI